LIRPLLALLPWVLPAGALAQAEPYPSRRTPSLQLGVVGTYTEGLGSERLLRGAGGHLDLGGSFPVGHDQDELFLLARVGTGKPGFGLAAHGGYRSLFSQDAWQTFTELGVIAHARPSAWGGARVAVGVRYLMGHGLTLYGGAGGQMGFGAGLRLDAELFSGVSWNLP
jgi:hypothetical protein